MDREFMALFIGGTVGGKYLSVPFDKDSQRFLSPFRVPAATDENRFAYQEYWIRWALLDDVKRTVFVLNGDDQILKNYIDGENRKRM